MTAVAIPRVRTFTIAMVVALTGACTPDGGTSGSETPAPSAVSVTACEDVCSWNDADPDVLTTTLDALTEVTNRAGSGAPNEELVAYLTSLGASHIEADDWGIEFAFPGGLPVTMLSDVGTGRFGDDRRDLPDADTIAEFLGLELALEDTAKVNAVPAYWDPAGEPAAGVRVLILEPYRYEDPEITETAGDRIAEAARSVPDKVREVRHLVNDQVSLEIFLDWNQWDVIFWFSHGSPDVLGGGKALPYLESTPDGWALRGEIGPGVSVQTASGNNTLHLSLWKEFFQRVQPRGDQLIYLGLCDSMQFWATLPQPDTTALGWTRPVPQTTNHQAASALGELLFRFGYASDDALEALQLLDFHQWTGERYESEGTFTTELVPQGTPRRGRDTVTLRDANGEALVDGSTVPFEGIPGDGEPDILRIEFLLEAVPTDEIEALEYAVFVDDEELESDITLEPAAYTAAAIKGDTPQPWTGSGVVHFGRDLTAGEVGLLSRLRIEVKGAMRGHTAHEVEVAMGPCFWSGTLGGADTGFDGGRSVSIDSLGGNWRIVLGRTRADASGTSVMLSLDRDPTVAPGEFDATAAITTPRFPLSTEGIRPVSRVRITLTQPDLVVGGVAASATGLDRGLTLDNRVEITFDGVFVWSPACPTMMEHLLDRAGA